MSKQNKSKEYTGFIMRCEHCAHKMECKYFKGDEEPEDFGCNADEISSAFGVGWDAALGNQWISTEERMPEPNTDVIFLTDIGMIMNGCYDGNCWMQMDGVWGSAYSSINKCWKVIAWMPNPSFDNVLKNK